MLNPSARGLTPRVRAWIDVPLQKHFLNERQPFVVGARFERMDKIGDPHVQRIRPDPSTRHLGYVMFVEPTRRCERHPKKKKVHDRICVALLETIANRSVPERDPTRPSCSLRRRRQSL